MHPHVTRALPCSVLLISACSSEKKQPPPAAPAGRKVDASTTGSIAGKVTLTGKAPAPEVIRMTSDAGCVPASGSTAKSDAVLVSSDGLGDKQRATVSFAFAAE